MEKWRLQWSTKWSKVLHNLHLENIDKFIHGWNSSFVQPLLSITDDLYVKYKVIQIVHKLLLKSDLYCLIFETPEIIQSLKEWLLQLLVIDELPVGFQVIVLFICVCIW